MLQKQRDRSCHLSLQGLGESDSAKEEAETLIPQASGRFLFVCYSFFLFFLLLKKKTNNNSTFRKSRTTIEGLSLSFCSHRPALGHRGGHPLSCLGLSSEKVLSGSRSWVLVSWATADGSTWCCPRLQLLQLPPQPSSHSPNQSQKLETLGNLFWSPQGTLSRTEPSPDQQEMTPISDKVSLRSYISTPADTAPVPWFIDLSHLGSLLPHPRSIPAGTGVTDAWPAPSGHPHTEKE